MRPDQTDPDRHARIRVLISGLRNLAFDEAQQLAVNKLEQTMLRAAPVCDQGRKKHEHGIFLCCLRELVNEVKECAGEVAEVEPDKVEALFELLFSQVEEAWEPLDEDIVAPPDPDPYDEQRADFEDDVMSDLLKS